MHRFQNGRKRIFVILLLFRSRSRNDFANSQFRDYSSLETLSQFVVYSISSGSRCLSRQRCSSSHNNSVCHASYALYIVGLPDTTRVNKWNRLETNFFSPPLKNREKMSLSLSPSFYIYTRCLWKSKPSRLIESPDLLYLMRVKLHCGGNAMCNS